MSETDRFTAAFNRRATPPEALRLPAEIGTG
jgi:hypothetical protein